MLSKITQPTLKSLQSNYSYDAKAVICGGSEKSLSLESYGFLINAYCFVLMGKGILAVLQNVLEPSTLHNEYSTIYCE